MKANALAKILESYSKFSPPNNSHDWAVLAQVFASAKTKIVADFVTELRGLASDVSEGSQGLGALLPEITSMQATAYALGKEPIADALGHLKGLASSFPSLNAQALQGALKDKAPPKPVRGGTKRQAATKDASIVPGYNSRLEEALGDESGFADLIAQLGADKRLSAGDFKQLAKMFAGRVAKNKGDAIEAINARHRNLMDARAKQSFNSGRTAA
jgi:hypothetical protein